MKGRSRTARLSGWVVLLAGFVLLVGAGDASRAAAQEGSGLLVTAKEGYPDDIAAMPFSYTVFTLQLEPEASCWGWPPELGGSFYMKAESSTNYGVAYIRDLFASFSDFPLDVEFSYNSDLPTPAPEMFPISAALTITANYCPPGSEIVIGIGCSAGDNKTFKGGLCVVTRQVTILPPESHSTVRGDVRIDFQNDQDRYGVSADGKSHSILLVDINEKASCWGEPVDRMGHFSMKASTTLGSISPGVAEVESWPIPVDLAAGTETGDAQVSIEFTYCPPDAIGVAGVCTDPNAEWRWNSCKGTVIVPFVEPPSAAEEKPEEKGNEPPQEAPPEGQTEMEPAKPEEEAGKSAAPAESSPPEEGQADRRTVADLARELEQFLGVAGAKDPDLARAAAGSAGIGTLILIWVVMNRQSGAKEEDLFEAVRKWRWGDAGGPPSPPTPPQDVPETEKGPSSNSSTALNVPEADKVPVRKAASPSPDPALMDLARKPRPDEAAPPRPAGPSPEAKAWRDAVDENFSNDASPPRVELPGEVVSGLDRSFQRSLSHASPNEVGGVVSQRKDATFTLTQETLDEGLAHTVHYPPAAADPQPVGSYHTHAFGPDKVGDVNIAPSDGDFNHLFTSNTSVAVIQTGGNRQWLIARTTETARSHEVNPQEITELFVRKYNEAQAENAGYEEGVRRAAIEVANRYKLKLYTGQNGKLALVNP